MFLFAGPPGRVLAFADPAVQGLLPSLAGLDPTLDFAGQKSLITRMTVANETNHQFMHTIGGDIYIYVFGNRIGQATVSGLSIAYDCDRGGDREHGFEKVLRWYRNNRLSQRSDPVTLLIGRTPLSGFVTGVTGGVFDHRLNLMQFDLNLAVVPDTGPAAGGQS